MTTKPAEPAASDREQPIVRPRVGDAVIVEFAGSPEIHRVAAATEDGRAVVFPLGTKHSNCVKVEKFPHEWPVVGVIEQRIIPGGWFGTDEIEWRFIPQDCVDRAIIHPDILIRPSV